MRIFVFLLVVGVTIAAAASTSGELEDLPDGNIEKGTGTFPLKPEKSNDEMEPRTSSISNYACSTGKACRRAKGTCMPSSESCEGQIVNNGCGTNCTCCIMDKQEEVDWSSLIIPHPSTSKMSWIESWYRCQSYGATPFVPRTRRDFQVIKSVRITVGYLWLPASDLGQEGELKWWNGEDASGAQGLEWHEGVEMSANTDGYGCTVYGTPVDGVHMWDCSTKCFPMICYKNN